MKTFAELQAEHIAELEKYLADLDHEYKSNREPAQQELDRLRNNARPGASNGAAQSAKNSKQAPALTPTDAVHRVAPTMDGEFTISDLRSAVNRSLGTDYSRETIRGAFRYYLEKKDCPITVTKKGDGPRGDVYKRKPAASG